MSARLFFLHLPKCGGMTVARCIEASYAPEAIYTVPSVSWNGQNFAALRDDWTAADRARLAVVKGHQRYGWHEAFPGDPYEYLTVLRHPVERTLSYYSYIGDWHPDGRLKAGGLAAFVRACDEVQNGMTAQIGGGHDARGFIRAWNRLAAMPIVGIVSQLEAFLRAARSRYGWAIYPLPHENRTEDRLRDLPAPLTRLILRVNRFDLMLWAEAQRRGTA